MASSSSSSFFIKKEDLDVEMAETDHVDVLDQRAATAAAFVRSSSSATNYGDGDGVGIGGSIIGTDGCCLNEPLLIIQPEQLVQQEQQSKNRTKFQQMARRALLLKEITKEMRTYQSIQQNQQQQGGDDTKEYHDDTITKRTKQQQHEQQRRMSAYGILQSLKEKQSYPTTSTTTTTTTTTTGIAPRRFNNNNDETVKDNDHVVHKDNDDDDEYTEYHTIRRFNNNNNNKNQDTEKVPLNNNNTNTSTIATAATTTGTSTTTTNRKWSSTQSTSTTTTGKKMKGEYSTLPYQNTSSSNNNNNNSPTTTTNFFSRQEQQQQQQQQQQQYQQQEQKCIKKMNVMNWLKQKCIYYCCCWFNYYYVGRNCFPFLYTTFIQSYFFWIGIPLYLSALFFYYILKDPILPIMTTILRTTSSSSAAAVVAASNLDTTTTTNYNNYNNMMGGGISSTEITTTIKTITISWFLDFLCRQVITFELANMTEYILLRVFLLRNSSSSNNTIHPTIQNNNNRTPYFRNTMPPYLILFLMQAIGYPFILTMWSIYDCFLLRGTGSNSTSTEFQQHWLYWTGWKIYSTNEKNNLASDLLSSVFYLRCLLSMLLIGVSVTIKRTVVAIRFGKRLLVEFKPRMQLLLAEIVLVNEIAVLAENIETITNKVDSMNLETENNNNNSNSSTRNRSKDVLKPSTTFQDVIMLPKVDSKDEISWSNVQFTSKPSFTQTNPVVTSFVPQVDHPANMYDASECDDHHPNNSIYTGTNPTSSTTMIRDNDERDMGHSTKLGGDMNTINSNRQRTTPQFETIRSTRLKKQAASGNLAFSCGLDPWEDPIQILNAKTTDATIEDILNFKRALGYMDESHPFGDSFGPASNRDEAIHSAHYVYWKLMKMESTSHDCNTVELNGGVLNFDVLLLLASNEHGVVDPEKMKNLRKLFRPDSRNQIPLLSFVQACDSVYKHLRFFRASVTNSSAIDGVLENMVDGIFYFLLMLFILELMDFDPYTLLASSISLLVSVSFALGNSVSQFVEGLLMIAVRRPFDLGDRILIIGAESTDKPAPTESYFVEDITLLKTTLRYARTNEVSMVNNYSISKARIVNLQRSVNASIFLEMKFKAPEMLKNDTYLKYRSLLEQYVADNTSNWHSLVAMRHDEFDPDWEHVVFKFLFRHRSSWQSAGRVLQHRSDLVRFMYEKGKELGIHWETPIPRRTVFDGGVIENDIVRPRQKGIDISLFANNNL